MTAGAQIRREAFGHRNFWRLPLGHDLDLVPRTHRALHHRRVPDLQAVLLQLAIDLRQKRRVKTAQH